MKKKQDSQLSPGIGGLCRLGTLEAKLSKNCCFFSGKRGRPREAPPIDVTFRHPQNHSDRYWIEPKKDSGGVSDFSQERTDSFSTMKRTKRRKFWAAICLAIPFVSTNCLDNPIANAQQGCSELPGSACDKACDAPWAVVQPAAAAVATSLEQQAQLHRWLLLERFLASGTCFHKTGL
jgi:hypothetical protein